MSPSFLHGAAGADVEPQGQFLDDAIIIADGDEAPAKLYREAASRPGEHNVIKRPVAQYNTSVVPSSKVQQWPGEDIGERGQWLFCTLLTELCGRDDPFFRPRFLGEKYPTFDYIVEVVDNPAYFFFVQVKATTQGYTAQEHRLKIQVDQEDINRMVACPAPTYVVGMDITMAGQGFLLSVNEPRDHVASLTTRFRIDCALLAQLGDEVIAFWSSRNMVLAGSRFRE